MEIIKDTDVLKGYLKNLTARLRQLSHGKKTDFDQEILSQCAVLIESVSKTDDANESGDFQTSPAFFGLANWLLF